ncbi:SRC kinase signaling inhibitor 1, partial [Saguinus oedipus]
MGAQRVGLVLDWDVEPERGLQVSEGPAEEVPAHARFLCDSPHVDPATLFLFLQSGGGSVPPMKVVTPGASRLKAAQGQAGSPDKSKHGKQRAEYMRIQAQQQ